MMQNRSLQSPISVVDLFCGIGGLSHGLERMGFNVVAGYDTDASCRYAYESNNKATFFEKDVAEISGNELKNHFSNNTISVLVGCAPCQPFSTFSNSKKSKPKDKRWKLLQEFKRLVKESQPDIVSMENVPHLARQSVYDDFVSSLKNQNYQVSASIIHCPAYGIPQTRRRLVLLASKIGPIEMITATHETENISVADAIGHLPAIEAGTTAEHDPLHRSQNLSDINLRRIRQSKPGGTWRDWDDELILPCHRKKSGSTYASVYGRMRWDKPGPTITTQFILYGTGRFGHPAQDRAISLREGALLQTFPPNYRFAKKGGNISLSGVARQIGNAVPVRLGEVIGESIKNSLLKMNLI